MTAMNVVIVIALLNLAIIVWWVLRVTMIKKRRVQRLGKLSFERWYHLHKKEILREIEKKGVKQGFNLEAEIDRQYELYLLH